MNLNPASWSAGQRDAAGGIATLAFIAGILLVMARAEYSVPDVHAAQRGRAVVAVIAGLSVMAGGVAVMFHSGRRASVTGILAGIVSVLLGLPLVGVTVGLPAALEPIFGLMQAIVNLLNLLLKIAGKVAS